MTAKQNRRTAWKPEQIALLTSLYPDTPTSEVATLLGTSTLRIYGKASSLGLKKSPEFLASNASGRLQAQRGERTRFKKGMVPWNKGKQYEAGGKSLDTRFKKGDRTGRANQIYQPIGAERISKDGYLQRKINDDMPMYKRWRGVHIIVWEAINGPLPAGHALCFKDGNKQNTAFGNLELVTRAELMRRNTCHRYPKEIAQLVQLRGAITRKINRIERKSNGQ